MKSDDTSYSSVYLKIPFSYPFDASNIFSQTFSYDVGFFNLAVRSTTETSAMGTLNAIPVIFPSKSGITLPTAVAAPVEAGIILHPAALPILQFFYPLEGPSTVS